MEYLDQSRICQIFSFKNIGSWYIGLGLINPTTPPRTPPKIGAIIASMPLPVLGGGVIVMFGMVAAAGLNVLSEVKLNRRNMAIIAVSLAVGLGLNLVPSAVQYLPGVVKVLATSAVAPTALVAVILNLVLPEED